MSRFSIKSTATAVAFATIAFGATGALADTSKCSGLSGYYGTQTAIVVSELPVSGSKYGVGIVLANGARPNAYGTCDGSSLTVNFTDDHVINGTHNGKSISWDNNTSWTKQ